MGLRKLWCFGDPKQLTDPVVSPERPAIQPVKALQPPCPEESPLVQSIDQSSAWVSQCAVRACASLLETAREGAFCWPARVLNQLKTLHNIMGTRSTSLVLFSNTPMGTAACAINAPDNPCSGAERVPAVLGWNGTALYDRLAKHQDPDVVTVISRFHDPLLGPEAACISAHHVGPPSVATVSTSGALMATGASAASFLPAPLVLRPDDLLALPIAPGGNLAAALLLGWGGGEPPATANSHANGKTGGNAGKGGAAANGGCNGTSALLLGPSELTELRRLSQLLGFGLLSDPRQAASLEQLAVLFSALSGGGQSGLDDLLAPLLEGVAEVVRRRHALQMQPLLAAVPAGHGAPAVVFARRQAAAQPARGLQRATSTPGFGSRGSHGQLASIARPALGGSVLGLASPSPASSRKKLLEATVAGSNLGMRGSSNGALGGGGGAGGGRQSSGVFEYIGAAGDTNGTGLGSGVSRIKAVRAALSHTLLQRVLRSPSDGGGGGNGGLMGSSSCPPPGSLPVSCVGPISTLVVGDCSSQVLEEERPGRDVLLASNLTGGSVAAMLLCAETQATHGPLGGGGGGGGAATAMSAATVGGGYSGYGGLGPMASYSSYNGAISGPGGSSAHYASASAVLEAALAESSNGGGGGERGRIAEAVVLLPGGVAATAAAMAPSALTATCSGTVLSVVSPAAAASLSYRLALYLVAGEAVPVGVLEAVAEEMTGLLPLVFEAFHAAVGAGGPATAEWCQLQAQLLGRSGSDSQRMSLDIAPTSSGPRRPAPPAAPLPFQPPRLNAGSPLQARAPPSASARTPRGGPAAPAANGAAGGPGGNQRSLSLLGGGPGGGTCGGSAASALGGSSRLRLVSPAGCKQPVPGDPMLESVPTSLSSEDINSQGGGRGVANGSNGGRRGFGRGEVEGPEEGEAQDVLGGLATNQLDDILPPHPNGVLLQRNGSLHATAKGFLTRDSQSGRKASAPCYLPSPMLQLEDIAGPRPLELLVSSARTRLSAVAAEAEAGAGGRGDDAKLAVQQDLAAVELRDIIGTGGQGVVFLGSLHGLETAVKVWEHAGRAPLEHDGEWLSAGQLHPEWPQEGPGGGGAGAGAGKGAGGGGGGPAPRGSQGGNGGGGGGGDLVAPEAIVSSEDCIRQAKRGAMEVAVTATLSHPNVVQTYAHFSDVVVVQRAPPQQQQQPPPPANGNPAAAPGGPDCSPACLRLVSHDDPLFRGAKAGPLNTVLCLEYCDAGTLLSAARRGDFRLAGSGGPRDGPVWPDLVPLYTSLLEVALALRYLHGRRLVHCDLKPGNVLLKSAPRDPRGWTCKLSDFGCVRLMDEYGPDGAPGFRMAQVFGTVAYMAPECFFRGRLLGGAVDVYAFGVLMWELLHCRTPHSGTDPKELPALVVRCNARPEFHPLAPLEYCALASRCWSPSPERRPTATQLVSQLQQLLEAAKDNAAAAAAAAAAVKQQRRLRQAEARPAAAVPQPVQLPPLQHGSPHHQNSGGGPAAVAAPQSPRVQLMRYPSAHAHGGEGRLAERVVLEQAHLAAAHQQQQQMAAAAAARGSRA